MKIRLFGILFAVWFVFLGTIFSSLTLISTTILQNKSYDSTRKDLVRLANQAQKDLISTHSGWDTTRFNSDPLMPYPNSSGAFPLYIMTSTGFIISRSNPIAGLLDTDNQKSLALFSQPTTIHTVTNESWRVLSKQIKYTDSVSAVIFLAYYNPQDGVLASIDEKLATNADTIAHSLQFSNGSVDATNVDIRNIDYQLSFEIVDQANRVLLSNGRTPAFIDPSYVYQQLSSPLLRVTIDNKTKETFLTYTQPLKRDNKSSGIIVVGKSIQSNITLIQEYAKTIAIILLLCLLPLTLFAVATTLFLAKLLHIHREDPLQSATKIYFDVVSGTIYLNKDTYSLDKDSLQFALCKSVFNSKDLQVSQDKAIQELGLSSSSKDKKKIYDAMIGVNKKVNGKFLIFEGKYYKINAGVASKVIKKS